MRVTSSGATGSACSSSRSTTIERDTSRRRTSRTSTSATRSRRRPTAPGCRARRPAAPGAGGAGPCRRASDSLTSPERTRVEQAVAPGAVRSGHLQVEATLGGTDHGLGGHPVADHDAVEAPLVLEDAGEQRAVLEHGAGRDAVVDTGVGAHHRPRLRLADELLERREVDLAQRALVDAGQVAGALGLGVVGDEVLDAHADAAVLRGPHHVHGDRAGEQRVLGVALEVAAADGRALQVDLRGEHHVDAVPAGLGGEHRTDLVGQVHVPRRGERARRGERRRGLVGAVRDAAHAGGAVRDVHGAQADVRHGGGRPQAGTDDEANLLLEREAREQCAQRGFSGGGPFSRGRLGGRVE